MLRGFSRPGAAMRRAVWHDRVMETQPSAVIEPMRSRSQVAIDIARLHPLPAGSGRGHKSEANTLADRMGITRATVCRAREVLAAHDVGLLGQIEAGAMSVHKAVKILRARKAASRRPRR